VPDDGEIEIRLQGQIDEVALTLDGQIGFPLMIGDRVIVRKSRTYFNIVQPLNHSYFEVLRDKLRWGR
jgi:NAD+ kinase